MSQSHNYFLNLILDWGWQDINENDRKNIVRYFDCQYYRNMNPEIPGTDLELFIHYLVHGWRQGRNPNDSFRTLSYICDHPALIGAGVHPFFHHIETLAGFAALEGRTLEDMAKVRADFDETYYRASNIDIKFSGTDPFMHYMTQGWIERRDPHDEFSTQFYLASHPDIDAAGVNPFVHWVLHGKSEKRAAMSFRQRLAKKRKRPRVSAIVPNYNHGKFLAQRLDSILDQTYPDIDILVLDDCSADDSRVVIDSYARRFPGRIDTIYNETNSGGVFNQWRKGTTSVDGELIWICESDDFCERDFVEKLVPYFADDSVQMAFGRILETDVNGVPNAELDGYRERAEAGIWDEPLVRPAANWFARGFGVNNVIANVGGCLWRRAPISEAVWRDAATYRVVGDWYLYLKIAGGGQIAYEPRAVSYFRRHGTSTSMNSFTGTGFYSELERVMIEMRKTWNVPDQTVRKFYDHVADQYRWFELEGKFGPLGQFCSLDRLLETRCEKSHLLIAMLGFVPGGGENFPIQLANGLIEANWIVSMIIFDASEVNEHMRASLNPSVSVYEADWVVEYGCDRFVHEANISLIHSHTIGAEMRFYHLWELNPELPYVVTLHGSYESSDIPTEMMDRMTRSVDHFVYTADKNLLPLQDRGIAPTQFTKMANAMPVDPLPFPATRADLGIPEDAIVFTLVARGIKRKGWRAAIEAFQVVRERHPERRMHLCLVGEGDEPDRLRKVHGADSDISFLGYQSRIHGLYRMSDVAVVPTRFVGESYPLCIIQALQMGCPVVSTDVGEIAKMLCDESDTRGGLAVEAVRDTEKFIADFADAMTMMLDDDLRRAFARGAQLLGDCYDMDRVVRDYSEIYDGALARAGSAGWTP